MAKSLMEYFNREDRLGVLATSAKSGEVDCAYFGSPRMIDESTVVVTLGDNKTLANLKQNPHACYFIMEPGKSIMEWKGLRIYLKMIKYETQGETLEAMKKAIAERAGEAAAKMMQAAVTFSVSGLRPLADFGQGWENSI
jgi:hypothetical protein